MKTVYTKFLFLKFFKFYLCAIGFILSVVQLFCAKQRVNFGLLVILSLTLYFLGVSICTESKMCEKVHILDINLMKTFAINTV